MPIRQTHPIRLFTSDAGQADVAPPPETADDLPSLEQLGAQLYSLGLQHRQGIPSNADLNAIGFFTDSALNALIEVIQMELLRLQEQSIASMTGHAVSHVPIDEEALTPRQQEYRDIAYLLLDEIQPLTEDNLRETLELFLGILPPPVDWHAGNEINEAVDDMKEAGWKIVDADSPAVHYHSEPTMYERFWRFGASTLAAITPSLALSLLRAPALQQDAALSTEGMDITPDRKA